MKNLKEYLIENELLTNKEYESLVILCKNQEIKENAFPKSLTEMLVEEEYVTEKEIIDIYTKFFEIPFIALNDIKIPAELTKMVPLSVAKKYGVMPFGVDGEFLQVVMKDPFDLNAKQQVKFLSKKNLKIFVSYPSAINRCISNTFSAIKTDQAIEDLSQSVTDSAETITTYELKDDESDVESAAARFVNAILKRAIADRASDIHIEPLENKTRARIRIDGILRDIQEAPKGLHQTLVSRIKVMGDMDVAERRIPQDGRSGILINGEEIDLRISSLPTVFGEKIVIRLLRKSISTLDKKAIGLREEAMKKYDKMLDNHNGVILMVGPTGSGKSTTMVTMIKVLNTDDVNVITLEDPVEYNIPGISQVQINDKKGMTFAKGLKAAMRQDPDIICVGEIRDGETAEIAMRAAITGHLVISTVHTNDAVSTFERLTDMGVAPYLVAQAILGIVSQRLVRKICPQCKEEYIPTKNDFTDFNFNPEDFAGKKFYKGKGCPMCSGTGYSGRTGVFEILTMTPELRRAIAENKPHSEVVKVANESGYIKMKQACMELVESGETTFDEMRRTINAIE